jgi:uncharacterized Zn finger protein
MELRVYLLASRGGGVISKCPECGKVTFLKRVINSAVPVIYSDDGFTLRKKEPEYE